MNVPDLPLKPYITEACLGLRPTSDYTSTQAPFTPGIKISFW